MAAKVEVPPLGESITEAILVRWLKADGDRVGADEPICELETDKANVDLPAPAAGVLRRIKGEGDTVHVGEAVAQIEDAAGGAPTGARPARSATAEPAPKAGETPPAPAAAAPPGAPDAPLGPAVRRMIEEHQIDPTAIRGTGRGGRLTPEDVGGYLAEREQRAEEPGVPAAREEQPAATEPQPALETEPPPRGRPAAGPAAPEAVGVRRVPMSKIRRRIAERLVAAQRQAAMLTTFNEVDMTSVLDLRSRYRDRFQEVHGVALGLMSFFARASVVALQEFPVLNAQIDGDDIVYHEYVHLGIAVSTERGLVVPVLRHVEQMSFGRIEAEIKRMAVAARDGKLTIGELGGGTFTITNGGVFGSLLSTPILNAPQSGILGVHAIQKRPAVVDDRIEARALMYVALSYDHRLVDGKDSVRFLVRIKELLEDPARLVLAV